MDIDLGQIWLSVRGKKSRGHCEMFFVFFPKNRLDIPCKLSREETVCMKC